MSTEIQYSLPVRDDNKSKWDTLGVKWLDNFDGDPFLVKAQLPFGWRIIENPVCDFDKVSFVVLDEKDIPKADAWFRIAAYNRTASVRIFSNKEDQR